MGGGGQCHIGLVEDVPIFRVSIFSKISEQAFQEPMILLNRSNLSLPLLNKLIETHQKCTITKSCKNSAF